VRTAHEQVVRVGAVAEFTLARDWSHTLVGGARLDAAVTPLGATPDMSELAFDGAYAANEAAYHISLLEAIDAFLIPAARSAGLRDLFVTIRRAVAAHLEHARSLSERKSTQ